MQIQINKLIMLVAIVLFLSSFTLTKEKAPKTIIDKIEQNLLSGWIIKDVDDDKTKFSNEMNMLGFTYGLTLINQNLPTILETNKGKIKEFAELKIIVSTLEKENEMIDYVNKRATLGNFNHCFIKTNQHLLTLVWSESRIEYVDTNGVVQVVAIGKGSKYQKYRHRLIKHLNWYFDMYNG